MALFKRKNQRNDSEDSEQSERKKEKGGWRKPANTAFKQQRLKAWQPILTPKTVLPTLFICGIIFAPIGALLIWGSSLVSEMTFDYTNCQNLPNSTAGAITWTNMSSSEFSYNLKSADNGKVITTPQYAHVDNSAANNVSTANQCYINFQIVSDLEAPVFQYYKLTNFYQNNRRYVQSLDTSQLSGKYVSNSDLGSGNCKPLALTPDGTQAYYPCGLIANSVFNDSFSGLISESGGSNYTFSQTGIAWPGEAKKYSALPGNNLSELVPPPNWVNRVGETWNDSNIWNLQTDEHFQNWMRTAGLPTFTKLYGRNDGDTLPAGNYTVIVDMNFPVQGYKGTKSLVISTVSWIGGKNSFLGWAYVAAASVFILLALIGTVRHLVKPRRLGDMSLLSWNR
ncbi:cell cycle control protein [Coniophora puteana RWD-64-598 SS2]|uniref:Cell cycle control protein n=1 Tax=Coniophora puteana (strain RWD-64-598) TaxID=741705 RepID=A0A5M3N212_CONPW|nr:cell cycle control protein [Coniophora puteana RWD-64-598 SS2]EIW85346.1 cell cycle control protein [Coniophora puteana RWD-64-598 SS2]